MMMFCLGGLASGMLTGRKGPRFTLTACALFLLAGFAMASRIHTLPGIYVSYGGFCGFGVGLGYNATISTIMRWFPDKQGLVSGITLMGFGFGGMLLGTLGAYLVSIRFIGRENFEKSVGEALKSAGVVLLITGAGGSFSSVIAATGIGDSIVSLLSTGASSVVPAMFLCYLIGMIFRVAQGSGTVAGMTSMTIMATVAPAIGCHPVWLALACLSGGNSIGHVNDSGFWVATNMSGLTITGGLKTYTLGSFISSVFIFLLALIGALVIPL